MFKKKPNVKPFAPLRSSDRRKVAQAFIQTLELRTPSEALTTVAADGELTDDAPETPVPSFANILLPQNTTSAKFTTTAGPDLRNVNGTIYFGNLSGDEAPSKKSEQKPLWVKAEDEFPTVYTLWRFPEIIPTVLTHDGVMERIYGGADLMIPGLIGPFDESARKGRLVSVTSTSNPALPLAVGIAEIDISSLKDNHDKGKAVRILHWFGDELWNLGGGTAPPNISAPSTETLAPSQELQNLSLSDEPTAEGDPQQSIPDLSVKEIDAAFRNAALLGIKLVGQSGSTQLKYPLNSSEFFSQLVQPYLPPLSHFDPALPRDKVHPSLHVKKTSWKNAGKFLKQLDKEKVVRTKARNGNEIIVLDIDWEARILSSVEIYDLPATGGPSNSKSEKPAGERAAAPTTWKVIELYKPASKFAPIFSGSNADSRSYLPPAELREILYAYIEKEGLVSPTNRRLVSLNPVLANILLDERKDSAILNAGKANRDELAQRFISGCSPYYCLLPTSEQFSLEKHKPKSGKPPRVQILLEKRTGKKTVTRVSGVEPFGVNVDELAEELSKTCASSTSVSQLVGSSPKNPVMELMIQGPQKAAVEKALAARGVEAKWIDTIDKTGGKK